MIKFDFVVSNLALLVKCLNFSDVSLDAPGLNIYTKNGRVLMSSGDKVKVVVDTLINLEEEIDICVDCKNFIRYIDYIKCFEKNGKCSLLLQDNVLQIVDNENDKIKNNLYLEYIDKTVTKIRTRNFNELTAISPDIMKEGMLFVSVAAIGAEKYSSQIPGVLIKMENNELLLAGTDSVKCCIYRKEIVFTEKAELVIQASMARAISNIAAFLNKDAIFGYSSNYFKCNFGNVAIYSSIINTTFPSLTSLLNANNQNVIVNYSNIMNILKGANISTKGKEDQRLNIAISENIIRVHSEGFDSSMMLDTVTEENNKTIALNSLFVYSLCSLFKNENIIFQFYKQMFKITDNTGNKMAFLAALK